MVQMVTMWLTMHLTALYRYLRLSISDVTIHFFGFVIVFVIQLSLFNFNQSSPALN
jgi:hypothetical protein